MSLFFGRAVEDRAITGLPWSTGANYHSSRTMEHQLSLVPVFAATRLISDAVASLPLQAYRKTNDGRTPITLPALFENPSVNGTRIEWVQRCMMSLLLRGNAYGLMIGFDASPTPKTIEWLHPDKMRHEQHGTRITWYYDGREIPDGQLLHIPAMVVPGSCLGLSPIKSCQVTTDAGIATQKFMRDWFRGRAIPGMKFKNTKKTLTSEESRLIKERMQATMRAGEPFVHGEDWELDIIGLPADDAGFIAGAKLNATQVANIYGVPPEMVGGETGSSMTYSTTEMQQIQFLTYTVTPWLMRLEAAFSALLPRPQYVKFNIDAVIRVDTKTRHEVYQIDRTIGMKNVDELRELEDEEPLPNGLGQDYTPLAKVPAPLATRENR